MKLVSVIVPVYQAERYLDDCVKSILAQTYQNLEVLLIDDGSTDSSAGKCDEYSKLDSRVKVFHRKNGGVASARNAGLDSASGEYIMFVDSDDWIEKTMIADMLSMAIKENADLVECDFVEWKKGKKCSKPIHEKNYILTNKEDIFYHSFTNGFPYLYKVCWGKLIKTSICRSVRFPKRTVAEDAAFCDNVLLNCSRVIKCYTQYYNYRITPGSIMHSGINPTVFETMDTVLDMETNLRKESYPFSQQFWNAVDEYISNTALGIADKIIWNERKLSNVDGFDSFYQKCRNIALELTSMSDEFLSFVQDWRRWSRFRREKLFIIRIKRKLLEVPKRMRIYYEKSRNHHHK